MPCRQPPAGDSTRQKKHECVCVFKHKINGCVRPVCILALCNVCVLDTWTRQIPKVGSWLLPRVSSLYPFTSVLHPGAQHQLYFPKQNAAVLALPSHRLRVYYSGSLWLIQVQHSSFWKTWTYKDSDSALWWIRKLMLRISTEFTTPQTQIIWYIYGDLFISLVLSSFSEAAVHISGVRMCHIGGEKPEMYVCLRLSQSGSVTSTSTSLNLFTPLFHSFDCGMKEIMESI